MHPFFGQFHRCCLIKRKHTRKEHKLLQLGVKQFSSHLDNNNNNVSESESDSVKEKKNNEIIWILFWCMREFVVIFLYSPFWEESVRACCFPCDPKKAKSSMLPLMLLFSLLVLLLMLWPCYFFSPLRFYAKSRPESSTADKTMLGITYKRVNHSIQTYNPCLSKPTDRPTTE